MTARISKKYIIHGKPIPLARPRLTRNIVYDSQKRKKLIMIDDLMFQHGLEEMFSVPVHMYVDFYFGLPNDKKRKELLLKQRYHCSTPDLDNLIKMVGDVCVDSGVIKDDCLIASISARKFYDENGARTEFIISEIVRKTGE